MSSFEQSCPVRCFFLCVCTATQKVNLEGVAGVYGWIGLQWPEGQMCIFGTWWSCQLIPPLYNHLPITATSRNGHLPGGCKYCTLYWACFTNLLHTTLHRDRRQCLNPYTENREVPCRVFRDVLCSFSISLHYHPCIPWDVYNNVTTRYDVFDLDLQLGTNCTSCILDGDISNVACRM